MPNLKSSWIATALLFLFAFGPWPVLAAEPRGAKSASAAQIAACQKVRKDKAEGMEAQSSSSGAIGAGAAVGGVIGAIAGAVIAAGVNESNAEQAYQDCLQGKAVSARAVGGGGVSAKGVSAASGNPASTSRPAGRGVGACSNRPKSCSEARSMCNNVCATKNFGGRCSSGCIDKFQACKSSGVWTAERCTLTGLAQM